MLRVLLTLALLGFTVYAVVDCIQTEDERVRNLPKLAWVVIVLLFTPAGGIAWLLAGRPRDGRGLPRIGPGFGPFSGPGVVLAAAAGRRTDHADPGVPTTTPTS